MAEPLSTEPYKGVRDFYPSEWARLQTIFGTVRKTLALSGYEEYNASPLERSELYEAKTSEEIVSEQTYSFVDRGDRRVTLRPEMTPTLARMVAAKRRELVFPLRWFSIPNLFRYERPQRGRLREHYQVNVDLLGLPEGAADLEVIRVAHAILTAFGATNFDFSIRVNSRALLNAACVAAGITGGNVSAYLRALDRKAKVSAEEFAATIQELGNEDPLALIDNPTTALHVQKEKKKMTDLVSSLHATGITNAVFDPTITRGFDYYTGIVFEVFDNDPANTRSLFGGGRYDGLVGLFGSEPVPAIGFGMGDVTLYDFLETHDLLPKTSGSAPLIYLGTPAVEDIAAAETLAETLRSKGIRTWVNLTEKSLGDQIKDAVKRGIPFFAAHGKDEVASGQIRLKTLASSEEVAVTIAELPQKLSSHS